VLSRKDIVALRHAADVADAQRELMRARKPELSALTRSRSLAGPVVIAVAVAATLVGLTVDALLPDTDRETTRVSELPSWSSTAGG
jgi:hypothetical protein